MMLFGEGFFNVRQRGGAFGHAARPAEQTVYHGQNDVEFQFQKRLPGQRRHAEHVDNAVGERAHILVVGNLLDRNQIHMDRNAQVRRQRRGEQPRKRFVQHLHGAQLVFSEFVGAAKVVNFVGHHRSVVAFGATRRKAAKTGRFALRAACAAARPFGWRGGRGGRGHHPVIVAVAGKRGEQGFNFGLRKYICQFDSSEAFLTLVRSGTGRGFAMETGRVGRREIFVETRNGRKTKANIGKISANLPYSLSAGANWNCRLIYGAI